MAINKERISSPLLSLFCGCGGLDLGFEQSGFNIGLAYDIRQPAITTHNHNRREKVGFVRDITHITLNDLDTDYGEKFSPKGVIGGPPCQSFSRGNVSKKEDDPRKEMVRCFFTLALKLHLERGGLDFIVMENVPEVAKADEGKLLRKEVTRLKRAGFAVFSEIYNAADYGVPQNRKRMILIAINKSRKCTEWQLPKSSGQKRTVKDAIYGLKEPIFFADSAKVNTFPEHPNHWCMTPKSPKFHNGNLAPGRSTGRSFKTLGWDKQSYTVSYGHREVHVHPNCNRRLSVYEAMLLQGFPKNIELKGTMSDQFSQVSEAVPPPLAKAIAQSISDAIIPVARYRLSKSDKAVA